MKLTVQFPETVRSYITSWANSDVGVLVGCLNKQACLVAEYILTDDDGTQYPPLYYVVPVGESDTGKNSMYRLTSVQGLHRLSEEVGDSRCTLDRDSSAGFRTALLEEKEEGETEEKSLFAVPADRETKFNLPDSLPKQSAQDSRVYFDGKEYALIGVRNPEGAYFLARMNDPESYAEFVKRIQSLTKQDCGLSTEDGEKFIEAGKEQKTEETPSSASTESENRPEPEAQVNSGAAAAGEQSPAEPTAPSPPPPPQQSESTPQEGSGQSEASAPSPPPPPPPDSPGSSAGAPAEHAGAAAAGKSESGKAPSSGNAPETEKPAESRKETEAASEAAATMSVLDMQKALISRHYIVLPPVSALAEYRKPGQLPALLKKIEDKLAGYRSEITALLAARLDRNQGDSELQKKYEDLKKQLKSVLQAVSEDD